MRKIRRRTTDPAVTSSVMSTHARWLIRSCRRLENITANPDITALALTMISEELPRALIEEWSEEVMEVLIQQAREANSENAERALTSAFEALSAARTEAKFPTDL